jgi:hypothetical protein
MFGQSQIVLPNNYTVAEARLVTRVLGALLAKAARTVPSGYREPHAITGRELRSFAMRAIIGQPQNAYLPEAETQTLGELVRRILRLVVAEANAANVVPPSWSPLARSLRLAVAREARGEGPGGPAMAGAFGAYDVVY